MATTHRFALPDVGEGLTEAEVVAWHVAVGDVVEDGDTVVEVETAKSIVELPSPYSGTVTELLVPEGALVPVGTALIAVSEGGADDAPAPGGVGAAAGAASGGGSAESGPGSPSVPAGGEAAGGAPAGAATGDAVVPDAPGAGASPASGAAEPRESVLVGYGVRAAGVPVRRRRRTAAGGLGAPSPVAPPPAAGRAPVVRDAAGPAPAAPGPVSVADRARDAARAAAARVLAKPPVRALARDLGVDLREVPASGTGGVVTREDLLSHAAPPPAAAPAAPAAGAVRGEGARPAPGGRGGTKRASRGAASAGVLDAEARETRVPVRGVRRATAQQMVASAFTAPHATAFVSVDVTRTMKLLERLRADREFRDVHVSPLLMVARAVCLAVARHPGVNASWDEAAQEIVLKHYVNLGIAVATPRGLLVPSVKDADRLPLHRLALALTELVRTARDGRSTPSDLGGSTISITNIGVFGVDSGTPILNAGEAAILCVGAVKERPWVHKGKIKPRWVVDLSVSFDHRLVDGDLGSRFLADVAAVLERPDTAIRWG